MSNFITKVAIVGAGGNSGKFMTETLLAGGKHTVTALTRPDSQSSLPSGIIAKSVDYNSSEALVEALKGQDALIITLGSQVPKETDLRIIEAAGEAGVKWILPNEWGPDNQDDQIRKDVFVLADKKPIRDAIAALGKSNYIAVSTGFWYEWSLAIGPAFGIDIPNRTATLFDQGETKISTSTWPQVGRAVASILSLPITTEDSQPSLTKLANSIVYVKSFTISQKEMLESVLRVTGTKEADWTITKEDVKERYANGLADMQKGDRVGFAKMLYSRIFYPDGNGDYETRRGVSNKELGLHDEDLDEATARAVERSKGAGWL